MKVVVAHPGQQHSFKVASALKKNGDLLQFLTAVYDKPNNLSMKLAHKLVKGSDAAKILKRKTESLTDSDVTVYYTFLSLAVIVLSRSKATKQLSLWLDRRIADLFGKRVAKYAIKYGADAVICFSMNENTCFDYLRKHAPGIIRIVDCANSPITYMKEIYEQDMALFKHNELRLEVPKFWNESVLTKQLKGISYTQFFLAPSNFVKQGLVFSHAKSESINILHYGANFTPGNPQKVTPSEVRFIYVGQVTHRKGMHHLLKVFSRVPEADLTVVGWYNVDSDIYIRYCNTGNIHFVGKVPHEQVENYLKSSNVFVFDSLTEGFSLACLEAMSCGLPIICSSNSGANDIVVDNVNGFTVNCFEEQAFENAVQYFLQNPQRIPEMSEHAIESAKKCQWENYAQQLNDILNKLDLRNSN